MARRYYEEYLAEGPPVEPLLKGRDLLSLGFAPGPLLGEILRAMEDARREGDVNDREEALDWVRERYLKRKET